MLDLNDEQFKQTMEKLQKLFVEKIDKSKTDLFVQMTQPEYVAEDESFLLTAKTRASRLNVPENEMPFFEENLETIEESLSEEFNTNLPNNLKALGFYKLDGYRSIDPKTLIPHFNVKIRFAVLEK